MSEIVTKILTQKMFFKTKALLHLISKNYKKINLKSGWLLRTDFDKQRLK